MRVCLLGSTGTIGRATLAALHHRGHQVVCLTRPQPGMPPSTADLRPVDLMDPAAIARDGFQSDRFDAVVSCMASRTGTPRDAWAVDHRMHANVLAAAQAAGIGNFVLLSAICVQKPRLAFQHAKLAFEAELAASGLHHAIVRPTAYFKSLSGQVDRLRRGQPFLIFGDGQLTSCKPISDRDVANYLADCLEDTTRWNQILPIGGPGDPITPRQQGEALFAALGLPPKFRAVPVRLLSAIIGGLSGAATLWPPLATKAELARIGRYYATESMLVWDAASGRYDAAATPSVGRDTLADHYANLAAGTADRERGEHAVF